MRRAVSESIRDETYEGMHEGDEVVGVDVRALNPQELMDEIHPLVPDSIVR